MDYFKMLPAAERFRQSYIVNKVTGCWEWCGSLTADGYGRLRIGGRRMCLAHRFSYAHHNGQFDDALYVCHRCDNPPCVNPGHLFLGTAKDNFDDMVSKGRWRQRLVPHRKGPSGERSRTAKLTADAVSAIRMSDGTAQELAEAYGVTARSIYMINQRITWKHIP